jgi:hypothetical protein
MSTYRDFLSTLLQSVATVFAVAFICWLLIRLLRQSESSRRLFLKWFASAIVVAIIILKAAPLVGSSGPQAFDGIVLTLFCSLVFAAIWRHSIASLIAKPFESLYDGGRAEVKPEPAYSVAISKRKQGKYTEAVREIRKQLGKFPNDFQGQLMIAEILAENLNDLDGAQIIIHRLCTQPGHPLRSIAMALNTLADWHLTHAQDLESAKLELEKIQALLPDTAFAHAATQRIAHLGTAEHLLAKHDHPAIHVPRGEKNIGLLSSSTHLRPAEASLGQLATELVAQLEQHPFDTDAREKLSVLYADGYHRLDLATTELEQLIALPQQSVKALVHWLNLLADLQIRHGDSTDDTRRTLERIIEMFPTHASADLARNRLDRLPLEFKAKQKSHAVKLGSYEKNIGLKRNLPR